MQHKPILLSLGKTKLKKTEEDEAVNFILSAKTREKLEENSISAQLLAKIDTREELNTFLEKVRTQCQGDKAWPTKDDGTPLGVGAAKDQNYPLAVGYNRLQAALRIGFTHKIEKAKKTTTEKIATIWGTIENKIEVSFEEATHASLNKLDLGQLNIVLALCKQVIEEKKERS